MASITSSRSALVSQRIAFVSRVAKAPRAQVAVNAAAATRKTWCPGSPPPAHLDGSMVGDFGFDPLGLGKDPEALAYYREAELVHSRFAMAGVAGILFPSLLTHIGAVSIPVWYEAGEVAIKSSSIGFGTLLMTQLFLMGWVEVKRIMDFRKPGSQGEEGSFLGLEGSLKGVAPGYPGGVFDPMGFSKGNMEELKLKEIKNGRLAMVAMLGFFAEAGLGKDPLDALAEHLSSPFANNFTTNGVSIPGL